MDPVKMSERIKNPLRGAFKTDHQKWRGKSAMVMTRLRMET